MGGLIYHQQDYGTVPSGFETSPTRRSQNLNEWSPVKVIFFILWLCAFTTVMVSAIKDFLK
jgi:hypothetical protein